MPLRALVLPAVLLGLLASPASAAPGAPVSSVAPPVPVSVSAAPDPLSAIRATFPRSEWVRAEQVALCESGLRSVSSPPNRNGSRDHGLFQLNDGGTIQGLMRSLGSGGDPVALALDPAWNVRAAHVLWTQRGWQPWTCAAKLGIVAGLWSSEPGPNGGSAPFDRALVPAVVPGAAEAAAAAAELAAQRAAEAEAARTALAVLDGEEQRLRVELASRRAALSSLEAAHALLQGEASRVADDLVSASEVLSAREAEASSLRADLKAARSRAEGARTALEGQVRSAYISGPASAFPLLAALGSSDVTGYVRAEAYLTSALEHRSASLVSLEDAEADVASLSLRAESARREAAAARDALAAEAALLASRSEAAAQAAAAAAGERARVDGLLVELGAARAAARARLAAASPPAP